ncbi:Lrp/AsnC family transcriptional regulator [Aestuariibacter salexigens]|uniref:Lrp/AsnC family transcriptional regulator n=1 Tax=Aestuariibacter salexigens TaxID=226010 RepID=UPI00047D0CD3|nr:Lrp/AsnC family transcriptional regulator [Aestuariibacter salexigens]
MLSEKDWSLISILRSNARASISDMARALGVSRATVQSRMQRLEQQNVIKGYVLALSDEFKDAQVGAHVSIKVRQKLTQKTNVALRNNSHVSALYSISGEYDLIAVVHAGNLQQLSQILDDIGNLDGVERTNSSVILETKFER